MKTPTIQYPGSFPILFRAFTIICSWFNNWIFYISLYSCIVHFSHFMLLSNMSWLVKSVISSLECSINNLFIFQSFINISFIWLYKFPGINLPFLSFVGCNPPWSHKHSLLSIIKYLFLSLIVFSDYKWSYCFIEIISLDPIIAQPIPRFVFNWTSYFIIFNNSFQFILPQWNYILYHVTYDLFFFKLFFEKFKFSYSLLNIFDIFGYWFPGTKLICVGCDNVSFMYNIDTIISDPFTI